MLVSNACQTLASGVASLVVGVAPSIVQGPVRPGGDARATVRLEVGVQSPPMSYQWRFNGQAITGAVGGSYAITAAVGWWELRCGDREPLRERDQRGGGVDGAGGAGDNAAAGECDGAGGRQ